MPRVTLPPCLGAMNLIIDLFIPRHCEAQSAVAIHKRLAIGLDYVALARNDDHSLCTRIVI